MATTQQSTISTMTQSKIRRKKNIKYKPIEDADSQSHIFTSKFKQQIYNKNVTLTHNQIIQHIRIILRTPRTKRQRIDNKLLKQYLSNMKFNLSNASLLDLMIQFMEIQQRSAEKIGIQLTEGYKKLYLLIVGSCQIISNGNKKTILEAPQILGQKEINDNINNVMGVKCITNCIFITVRKEDYLNCKKQIRLKQLREFQYYLAKMPIFRNLDIDNIKNIAKLVQEMDFLYKGQVVDQAETIQYFYIIVEGEFKATYCNQNNIEFNMLRYGELEAFSIESLFGMESFFRICCIANNSKLYRIEVQSLYKTLQGYEMDLQRIKDCAKNQLNYYRRLIERVQKITFSEANMDQTPRTASRIQRIRKKQFSFYQTRVKSSTPPITQFVQNNEDVKLKAKFFSKDLAFDEKKRSATIINSFTEVIRSKRDNPKHILNIYEESQTQSNNPMYTIYKQKLKKNNIQLDIIQKLYAKSKTMNNSYRKETIRSKKEETEILMKRIQISSCRKRKNKINCLFNPQQIIEYSLESPNNT